MPIPMSSECRPFLAATTSNCALMAYGRSVHVSLTDQLEHAPRWLVLAISRLAVRLVDKMHVISCLPILRSVHDLFNPHLRPPPQPSQPLVVLLVLVLQKNNLAWAWCTTSSARPSAPAAKHPAAWRLPVFDAACDVRLSAFFVP
jgi:hypothetical protein